jgi:hypothetical protein
MMVWNNPPKFINVDKPKSKKVTPEMLAKSGSEDGMQAALFCWAAEASKQYPQLKWLFAVPNGGQRHIVEATKLVATGTRSGVPDVFLPAPIRQYPDGSYHGCWIEMKIEKHRNKKYGGLSNEQMKWQNYLLSAGYHWAVCYSWIEAKDTLIAYLEGKV